MAEWPKCCGGPMGYGRYDGAMGYACPRCGRISPALPESAAREDRVRCDECRKDDWRYDDPDLLPACPHPVAPPAGAAAQTVAGETMTMICYACARPMAPAPDARWECKVRLPDGGVCGGLLTDPFHDAAHRSYHHDFVGSLPVPRSAPDARDAVVEAARVIARDYDDDRLVRPEAVRALRTTLAALTPTGGDDT